MPEVEVDGTALYYEEKGVGLPLLFIHGMCGDARVWADQMERLSGQFRCIAYDRRGHTRSPLGNMERRTVELHADDAAGLIDALGMVPCVLVGSSGGARVAVDVLRRHPQQVLGAVLSEPPLFALDPPGARALVAELGPALDRAVASGGPRAAVDVFFEALCPGLWRDLDEARKDRYRANHVELFGDLQMPLYEISRADLARIDRPCLVVCGSESLALLRNVVAVVASAIPACRVVELAGSGHVTYYERPTEFAAAVADFAGALAGRAAGARRSSG